jgi:predicted HicB family RNase H-like nuclease
MSRTAFLVRCAADDAERIRAEAQKEQRSISSYVLQNTVRFIEIEDHAGFTAFRIPKKLPRSAEPRTAILVRCTETEAEQIRSAALRRHVRLNALIVSSLKKAWDATDHSSAQKIQL